MNPAARHAARQVARLAARRAARRAAMNHVLRAVVAAPFAGDMVLRGSAVLPAWLGDAAREPEDLDFVVRPYSLMPTEDYVPYVVSDLITAVRRHPGAGLLPDHAEVTSIQPDYDDYMVADEDSVGRRVRFPYAPSGGPTGVVQVDLAFNEPLPTDPVKTRLPSLDTPMLTASAELSLAWKLSWLVADPRAKDLYDATLLAEYVVDVPADPLVHLVGHWGRTPEELAGLVRKLSVDWEGLVQRYPQITGDEEEWKHRLARVLTRSFPPR